MLDQLLQTYGERFIRYVLGVDESQDLSSTPLTQEQQSVLAFLRAIASQAPSGDASGVGLQMQLSMLSRWQGEMGSSIANGLRAQTGAALPVLPTEPDPVIEQLLMVGRDVWPTLLLKLPSEMPFRFFSSSPVGLFGHPAAIEAAKHVLRDPDLARLFPGERSDSAIDELDLNSAIEVSSWWVSNAGRGGTQQLITLLGLLVTNACSRTIIKLGEPQWEQFCDELRLVISELRRLAVGETVNVPRCIAFVGLSLQEGQTVNLTSGTMRSIRSMDREYLLPDSDAATCVVETTFPLRILGVTQWRPGDEITRMEDQWEEVRQDTVDAERQVDLMRLSVLLAAPEDETWALSQVSSLIVDPTAPGGVMQWSGQRFGVSHGQANEDAESRIREWSERLREHHGPSLDIAMKRMLSSAANRIDPVDGFIDAVMAWENCFGTATETTFRVTSSIAALLETESKTKRLELQRRLKKLYEKRSRVVHGALELTTQDASELRKEAFGFALQVLRKLYSERTELLPYKSEDRSTRILLT